MLGEAIHYWLKAHHLCLLAGLWWVLPCPAVPATNAAPGAATTVTVTSPSATESFIPMPEVVRSMVSAGLTNLTGTRDANSAWRSLLKPTDVIGLKVYAAPGPNAGTRVAVVEAVVQGLLAAGIRATNLVIWDKHPGDLRASGFFELADRYGVRIASAVDCGYDPDVSYDSPIIGNLVWGDLEFGQQGPALGRKSFVSKLVSKQLTRIIVISPLLNHHQASVTGCLYSLAAGSVDNFTRFETDRDRLATALPEIYGLPELADRVALNIVDALLCQYEGSERGLLHYSTVLNELRFSKDPVALDVLSLQELKRQRALGGIPGREPNLQIYRNASLLELGISDEAKIRTRQVTVAVQAGRTEPAAPR